MALDRDWLDDEIVINLNEKNIVRRCKTYSVKSSVFTQPAAFTIRLGEPASVEGILADNKPGDPFELRLRRQGDSPGLYDLDVPMQTGRLDAVDMPASAGAEIELRGRDNMAALFDSYFVQDDSITEATYFDLTAKQLKAVGFDNDASEWLLTGETGREKAITNAGGGMRRSGNAPVRMGTTTVETLDYMWAWTPSAEGASMQKVKVSVPSAPIASPDAQSVEVVTAVGGQPKTEIKTLKAEVGQQRYQWLKTQYKRVGLFLWCIPNGQFALSQPNGSQEPAFRLQRRIRGAVGDNNIKSGSLKNDTVQRFSHTLVYGRAGGGKGGRGRIVGQYIDQAMADGGLIKQISYREDDVKTQKAADALAARYAAEARRQSRTLTYTVAGHSAPSLLRPGERFPFYVNCCVHVIDQVFGIDGVFYLSDVEFTRDESGGTQSMLTLMWPEDLVFAEGS